MTITVPKYVEKQDSQPHPRKIIRAWIKALMEVNVDITKWFCSRPNPVFLEEMPCGMIYFVDEPADHQGVVPRNYLKQLSIVIEVMRELDSERPNALDDWLDSRAYEIEFAMLSDRFLGELKGCVEDVVLVRTQPVAIEWEGHNDAGSVRLFFNINYRSGYFTNGELEEWLRFNLKMETPEGAETEDDVTIRTE